MSHICITTKDATHCYLSLGDTTQTTQLLNVLIERKIVTSKKDIVVTFDTKTNTIFVIGHKDAIQDEKKFICQATSFRSLLKKAAQNFNFIVEWAHVENREGILTPISSYHIPHDSDFFGDKNTMFVELIEQVVEKVDNANIQFVLTTKPILT